VIVMTTTPRHDELEDLQVDLDRPWNLVVWNDPVNLMTYVTYVFRKLFGFSKDKATRLMLQVHNEGRAIVATGPRERMEMDCFRLHRHGLWATMERA
jgi:ATP-dependent Clp protease adaptor protein ClpS